VTRQVFANDDDAVCNGEDLASEDVAVSIEDMYCLIGVFESNKTLHEDVMTNCCLASEPVQAPPMIEEPDMLCLQVCMIENGEKQKSNETKNAALQGFAGLRTLCQRAWRLLSISTEEHDLPERPRSAS
jgi:hypothetical protein